MHKMKLSMARNRGSAPCADGDTPNAIARFNFLGEVGNPNRSIYFRLRAINWEQCFAVNDT